MNVSRERLQCKYVQSSMLMLAPPSSLSPPPPPSPPPSLSREQALVRIRLQKKKNSTTIQNAYVAHIVLCIDRWTRREIKEEDDEERLFSLSGHIYTYTISYVIDAPSSLFIYSNWPLLRKILKDESKTEETNKRQLVLYWHTTCVLFLKLNTKNALYIASRQV
jgi:hypothetical protein